MLYNSYSSLISVLALTAVQTQAYKIDGSCGTNTDLVRSAAGQAFTMASNALSALNTGNRDPNVNRLVKLLFCGPNDDPAKYPMEAVEHTLQGIAAHSNEITGDVSRDPNEIVIYCGLDRVKKNKAGKYVDTASNTIIQEMKDHPLNDCNTGDPTLAFVWNPPDAWDSVKKERYGQASQVTICPWYTKYEAGVKFKTFSDIKPLLAKWTIPKASKWPFTPVDTTSLFDKVLLHEFTHTRAGGERDDVIPAKDAAPFFKYAYGWKSALSLAQQAPSDFEQSALNNADSIALFASGVRLLQNTPASYIATDGSVSNKAPSSKRADTTPVEFEGFITMIKSQYAAAATEVPEGFWQI